MKMFKKLSYKISVCFFFLFCTFSIKAQDATWEWAKGYGSLDHEQIFKIMEDSEGNTYFNGYTLDDTLMLGSFQLIKTASIPYNKLNFIAKQDKEGNILWVKSWQCSNIYSEFIIKPNDHIYIVATYSWDRYYSDDFPIDVSSNTWSDSYKLNIELLPTGEILDYSSEEYKSDRAQISEIFSNSYYQYGTFGTSLTLGSFTLDGNLGKNYIAKYDLNHQVIWARNFDCALCGIKGIVSNQEGEVFIFGILQSENLTIDNLSITNANTGSGITSSDVFIAKLNANGQAEWLYSLGDVESDLAGSMLIDNDGNITAVGSFHGATLNINGTVLNGNNSCANTFIFTFDTDFNILKSKSFGSQNNNRSIDIEYDGINYYVLGGVQGSMTIDGTYFEHDGGTTNEFILKLNANLDLINSYWMEDIDNTLFIDLYYGNNNDFYVIGDFRIVDLTFGSHVLSSTTMGTFDTDIFIAKLHLGGYAGLESEKESGNDVLVYPNPNDGVFHVVNQTHEKAWFSISNTIGQEIFNANLNDNNSLIDLNLEDGIYFLNLWTNSGIKKEKFIVRK